MREKQIPHLKKPVVTILSLDEGVKLDEQQRVKLENMLYKNFNIEPKNLQKEADDWLDTRKSYKRRAKSLHKAMLFLNEAIPHQEVAFNLDEYLTVCKNMCPFPEWETIEHYQGVLEEYVSLLSNTLLTYWKLENSKEAIELLNKAEEYLLMLKGRSDLATLSLCPDYHAGNYILQLNRQLPPCSQETLSELKVIKEQDISTTPGWFRKLPHYQQVYFHRTSPDKKSLSLLLADLKELTQRWSAARTDSSVLKTLKSEHQDVISLLAADGTIETVDGGIAALNSYIEDMRNGKLTNISSQLSVLRKLPYWFLCLPDHDQLLLTKSLQKSENIEDSVSFLPSRLRTVPGMANLSEEILLVLSSDFNILDSISFLRGANVASRDYDRLKLPESLRNLFTERNIKHLLQCTDSDMPWSHQKPFKFIHDKKGLLLLSLITPLSLGDRLPDYALNEQKKKALERFRKADPTRTLIGPNHPLNKGRWLLNTAASDPECNLVLSLADELLSENSVKTNIDSLRLPLVQAQKLERLIVLTLAFIRTNKEPNSYSLLKEFTQIIVGYNPSPTLFETDELINRIYETAKKNQRTGVADDVETSTSDSGMKALVELFSINRATFAEWQDWIPLFREQLLFLTTQHEDRDRLAYVVEKFSDLALLRNDYEALLNSGVGTSTFRDYNRRELFLATLAIIMFVQMDLSALITCVSGKDRTALVILHAVAMYLCNKRYGAFPHYEDAHRPRENFVDFFVTILSSGHMQRLAGINAPGADDVKNALDYLPGDITGKFGTTALKEGDRKASNNEPSAIYNDKANRVGNSESKYIHAAQRLSEDNREKILEKIMIVGGQDNFWKKHTYYLLSMFSNPKPNGVARYRKILDDSKKSKQPKKTSIMILADIYKSTEEINPRPSNRSDYTQRLYDAILRLYNHSDPESIVEDILEQLDDIIAVSYKSNHKVHS